MAVLNQNLEWSSLAADRNVADAFRGTPSKVLFNPGTTLCRFITCQSKKKKLEGNKIFEGDWWSEWRSICAEINRWKKPNVTPRDVIRARLAVPIKFNPELEALAQVILTKPVYGWKGITRHQEDSIRQVTYLGGAEQFYIPHLAADKDGLRSDVAYMRCFVWTDDLS